MFKCYICKKEFTLSEKRNGMPMVDADVCTVCKKMSVAFEVNTILSVEKQKTRRFEIKNLPIEFGVVRITDTETGYYKDLKLSDFVIRIWGESND